MIERDVWNLISAYITLLSKYIYYITYNNV